MTARVTRCARARPRRGFTLWELGLVLLVLAIVAGVAVPAFARLGAADAAEEGGVHELLAVLRAARRTAVAHGVVVTLVLDPASGRWRADSAGAAGTGLVAEDTLALARAGALAADEPRLRFAFRATGAAQGDTVVVRAPEGTLVVRVDPWSGEPRADAR